MSNDQQQQRNAETDVLVIEDLGEATKETKQAGFGPFLDSYYYMGRIKG